MVPVVRRLIKGTDAKTVGKPWTYTIKGYLQLSGPSVLNKIGFDSRGEIDLGASTP
jgi:hypothetical protein